MGTEERLQPVYQNEVHIRCEAQQLRIFSRGGILDAIDGLIHGVPECLVGDPRPDRGPPRRRLLRRVGDLFSIRLSRQQQRIQL